MIIVRVIDVVFKFIHWCIGEIVGFTKIKNNE